MLEPGRIISSEISSASTPGGINRTVRANRAESEIDDLAVALEEEKRRDEKVRKCGEGLGEEVEEKREARGKVWRRLKFLSNMTVVNGRRTGATATKV